METQQNPNPDNSKEIRSDLSNEVNQESTESLTEKSVNDSSESNAKLSDLTPEVLVDQLALLLQQSELPKRQQVEAYKSAFYKIKQQAQQTESESNSESNADDADVNEQRLKDLLNLFKDKNQKRLEEVEKQQTENLNKKQNLLTKLKELLSSSDEFGKISPIFHDIRSEWKEIGSVPESQTGDLQKEYNALVEQFYDLKQINDEFREYDFKKNLEAKRELISEAEKLTQDPDPIHAFRMLQNLHHQWRELGPVARDLRESIWNEFKTFSTTINRRHQELFENRKEQEQQNLENKTLLCEEVEGVLQEKASTANEWDQLTQRILDIQTRWKNIGFAPKKDNETIYQRFRKACDEFFQNKSVFFSTLRNELQQNLEKKRALLKEAEALKDSTDWKKTTDRLINLQKEWKKVGSVPRKYSNEIWKQFQTACDAFFAKKKEEQGDTFALEKENLKKKKDIIDALTKISDTGNLDEIRDKVNELTAEWRKVGHVPFKDKEQVYKNYHAALDHIYSNFKIDRNQRRLEGYSATLDELDAESDRGTLIGEKNRMTRIMERMKQELQTYTNNLSFLNISSKGGNGLLKEMEHKQSKLKQDIALMEEKIGLIDDKLNSIYDDDDEE